MGFDQNAYVKEFCRERYDRISLQVPKGQRERIKEQAAGKGYKSVNAYVLDLIEKDRNQGGA